MSLLSGVLAAGLLGGCAAQTGPGVSEDALRPAPDAVALSAYEASVGTAVEVYGSRFPGPDEARMKLRFEGTYRTEDGSEEAVNEVFDARQRDGGTLIWDTFGPFRVPFGSTGDEIGVFTGTITTIAEYPQDTGEAVVVEDGDPLEVQFRVLPSILVNELQPVTASCAGPILRAIGRVPYRLQVEAIGFEPEMFDYILSAPGLEEQIQTIRIRHQAEGRFDTVGGRDDFVVPDVPDDMRSYGAKLIVRAKSTDGEGFSNVFGFFVNRPLSVFYNGNVDVAEVESPQPVSACLPGGPNGRTATYDDTQIDSRSRGFELRWHERWLDSHTVSESSSRTVGSNRVNGIGFATTDEELFRWELGSSQRAQGAIPLVAESELAFEEKIAGQNSRAEQASRDRQEGVNQSETTTDSESITEANENLEGGAIDMEITSSEMLGRGFSGEVIAETFGVWYRQTMRLTRRGVIVAYNQCGIAEVVGEVDFTDWQWSVDLALGEQCVPLPKSRLPEAACYIEPCDNPQ